MTSRLAVLGVALSVLAGTARAQDNEWKTFSSKEGQFTVLLPGKPVERKQAVGNNVEQVQYLIDGGNKAYLIAYQDDQNFANADETLVKQALAAGRDAAVTSLKGTLLSQKEMKFDKKYNGMEFQIEIPGTGIYRSRIFMVKERLYQVTVLGPKEVAVSKEADRFLDSFKLTSKEK